MSIYVHPSAIVDDGAKIGEGTTIWHFVHVCPGARIGRNCSLGQNVYVAPTAVIGDGVKVQNNVSIYDQVTLEDDVFVGPSAVFTNVRNPRSTISRKHEYQATVVRKGATLGANCTIVCGSSIGEFAFIGAGATVTKDVPAHGLMAGVPARQRGWMCRCADGRLEFDDGNETNCAACGQRYILKDGEVSVSDTSKPVCSDQAAA